MGSEADATEITTFTFNENHFYIGGYNGSTIYNFDADLSSKGFTNLKTAYDFMMDGYVQTEFTITLDRYTPTSFDAFANKYITEGVLGKVHVGQIGTYSMVNATLMKNNSISIFFDVELSTALGDGFSPITIQSNNELYPLYQYLITK